MYKQFLSRVCSYHSQLQHYLGLLAPIIDLIGRIYVARVFILSGWSKITDWDSTLFLFMNEYHVPLLPAGLAAPLATFAELGFGVMLVFGVFTQAAASGLFLVNIVAVISYYSELSSSPAAIMDHFEWGIILGGLMVSSIHPWSFDQLINSKCNASSGDNA